MSIFLSHTYLTYNFVDSIKGEVERSNGVRQGSPRGANYLSTYLSDSIAGQGTVNLP